MLSNRLSPMSRRIVLAADGCTSAASDQTVPYTSLCSRQSTPSASLQQMNDTYGSNHPRLTTILTTSLLSSDGPFQSSPSICVVVTSLFITAVVVKPSQAVSMLSAYCISCTIYAWPVLLSQPLTKACSGPKCEAIIDTILQQLAWS